MTEKPSYQTLGLATLSALVVANMVGAGVFTSSGFSLGALGHPGRVMLAWWLCGLWAETTWDHSSTCKRGLWPCLCVRVVHVRVIVVA